MKTSGRLSEEGTADRRDREAPPAAPAAAVRKPWDKGGEAKRLFACRRFD